MQTPKISVRKVHLGNKGYNQIVGQRVFSADDDGELGWAKVWRGNNWNLTFRRVIKGCTSESPRTSGKEIVVGDSLEFNQANRGSLCVWLGKRNCSACNAVESGLISWRRGSLMGFLELRQAPGVYSRVMTGMPILNGSLFTEVRTLV